MPTSDPNPNLTLNPNPNPNPNHNHNHNHKPNHNPYPNHNHNPDPYPCRYMQRMVKVCVDEQLRLHLQSSRVANQSSYAPVLSRSEDHLELELLPSPSQSYLSSPSAKDAWVKHTGMLFGMLHAPGVCNPSHSPNPNMGIIHGHMK